MAFNGELLEIFSWLPAKSIYKFKSVCKSCNRFSLETFFTTKQSQNLQLNDDSGFFIQPDSCKRYSDKVELHPLPGNDSSLGVPNKSLQFLIKTGRILVSSNGLVLCRNIRKNPTDLFICNPATQTWLSIPTPESLRVTNRDVKIIFECNGNDLNSVGFPHDYMLLVMDGTKEWSSYYECKIYSPKEGIWKDIKNFNAGKRYIRFEMPVYYNGTLHFISDCFPYLSKGSPNYRPYIVGYDMEKGTSRVIRVPKEARRGSDDTTVNMGIFKWGSAGSLFKSICLIRLRRSVFTAWILKDYNSRSWTRIMEIHVWGMGLTESNPIVAGFTVMNGDSLVFATAKKVYRYGLAGKSYKKFEEVCWHDCGSNVRFNSYSNTLRPCGNGAVPLVS